MMKMTSYNRRLPNGDLETDALGGHVVYTMAGPADDRVHADAINIVTAEVGPETTVSSEQYYAQAGAGASAWQTMLARNDTGESAW